jgi:flavin-dependent dehydrogenase
MHLPGDGTYVGLNPGPDGLLNVSYVCDLAALGVRPGGAADERLQAVLAAVASLRDRFRASRIEGPVRVLAPLEVRARRVFDDRVLLVGDAAGFLDPLTGEGMYGAVVSGRIAGTLAAAAARSGATDARALRGYARARGRALGGKTRLNRGLQWLLRRRGVLEYLRRGLQRCPEIGDTLIEVIGNVRSPTALAHPVRLLRLLAKGRAA